MVAINMTERLTVISNGHERERVTWHDLPEAERQWHDYLTCDEDKYSPRFVHYRRAWYDVHEFMHCPDDAELKGWQGIHTETFFSGVLVRFPDPCEDAVVMGRDVKG
jgi:hypothetical protein